MFSIKTLCSLILIVFLLAPSHGMDIIKGDSQPRKFLKYSSADYKPINVTYDHSNVKEARDRNALWSVSSFIHETVLPPLNSFLRSTIKVLPRKSKIVVKSDACGDAVTIPAHASETGYDGDLVLILKTIDERALPGNVFVRNTICRLDETTNRPIVAALTFNVSYILSWDEYPQERRIAHTIHEIVHVLGFQEKLFPYFINPETMQPLTGHFFNKTVNDVNTLVLNVAPLTQKIRIYFNCPTAEGAYLENEGDSLAMNNHFERRIFGNELMTADEIFDRKMSQFTLALLEGTGWYKVSYDLVEPLTWGKNQGCAFLDTKCMDPETLKPNFKEFCDPLSARGLTWTKRGSGYCGFTPSEGLDVGTNPDLVAAFDYWGNKTVVDDKYSDNCPYYYTSDYSFGILQKAYALDCENKFWNLKRLAQFEPRGIGYKAFMGNLTVRGDLEKNTYASYCFKPKCVSKADGNYELQVNINYAGVVTCSAAGWKNASDFGFKNDFVGFLECPEPNEYCERIESGGSCKSGCFGNGVCSENQCQCKDGWISNTCTVKDEVLNSSRCTQDPLRTMAYGDECKCHYSNMTCQCLLGLETDPSYCARIIDYNNTNNNNNNNNSSNEPVTGSSNRAIYLSIGLVFVVIAVICIKRRKQADDLNTALVEGRSSHGISAF